MKILNNKESLPLVIFVHVQYFVFLFREQSAINYVGFKIRLSQISTVEKLFLIVHSTAECNNKMCGYNIVEIATNIIHRTEIFYIKNDSSLNRKITTVIIFESDYFKMILR